MYYRSLPGASSRKWASSPDIPKFFHFYTELAVLFLTLTEGRASFSRGLQSSSSNPKMHAMFQSASDEEIQQSSTTLPRCSARRLIPSISQFACLRKSAVLSLRCSCAWSSLGACGHDRMQAGPQLSESCNPFFRIFLQ